jgi:hypothetical protein
VAESDCTECDVQQFNITLTYKPRIWFSFQFSIVFTFFLPLISISISKKLEQF